MRPPYRQRRNPEPVFNNASTLVRTAYGHAGPDDAWRALLDECFTENEDGFRAYFTTVEHPSLSGLSPAEVTALLPADFDQSFLLIADEMTLTGHDRAALVLDLHDPPSCPPFRVIPTEMWSVEKNVGIANMDFHEFADSTDADGVFRGF